MESNGTTGGQVEYILPAHRLTGTHTEVLARLEEIIQGLVGLQLVMQRALIDERRAAARTARPALRLVGCAGESRRAPEVR
ncbi:MAG: hypothetical protein AB7I50_15830 [Vicinamibacterales bacterium]